MSPVGEQGRSGVENNEPTNQAEASNDEQAIGELIQQWAEAVHTGDLDTVARRHTDDIVMFDVPPPHDGVRGIDAYRATWPPFFEWQAGGACFELVELRVEAGDTIAFAWALLRCGQVSDFEEKPDRRLRLTLGLRKVDGAWIVAHEHHSFPLDDPAEEARAS